MLTILSTMLLAFAAAATFFAIFPYRDTESFRRPGTPTGARAAFGAAAKGWHEKWAQQYRQTGGKFKNEKTPGNVAAYVGGGGLVIGTLVAPPVGGILLAVIGVGGMWGVLGFQGNKRAGKISIQLADFVDAMRTALGRGATMEQALRQSIPLSEEPLRHDLLGVAEDMDLGYSVSEALMRLSQRAKSRSMTVACANLSMAVTASQAPATENLRELGKLIRQNNETVRDIKAETMLVRAAKNLFLVLPLSMLLIGWLYFGGDAYTTPVGFICIGIEVAISIGGMVFGRKADAWVTKGATL